MSKVDLFGGISGATFSKDHQCRFDLTRIWDANLPLAMFCGLNPSKAGADNNDPTITREMGFARLWGYGGMIKVNISPFISTDPDKLASCVQDVYDENHVFIEAAAGRAQLHVAAWGSFSGVLPGERLWVKSHITNLFCLGVNADGEPKHPLYLPKTAKLIPYLMEVKP
jgi:hypothetical protein